MFTWFEEYIFLHNCFEANIFGSIYILVLLRQVCKYFSSIFKVLVKRYLPGTCKPQHLQAVSPLPQALLLFSPPNGDDNDDHDDDHDGGDDEDDDDGDDNDDGDDDGGGD